MIIEIISSIFPNIVTERNTIAVMAQKARNNMKFSNTAKQKEILMNMIKTRAYSSLVRSELQILIIVIILLY